MFQADAERRILQACLDLLNHLACGVMRLPGLLRPPSHRLEPSQGHMGLPELGWIAECLSPSQGLVEPCGGLVTPVAGECNLALESLSPHQILPCMGAGRNVQALAGVLL